MLDTIDHALQQVCSPPLAPDDHAIDFQHLFRMTLGDMTLQREVLMLFDRQADMLLARMNVADPASVAALAHTLKGSAKGIGAWGVAAAAEQVESACTAPLDVGAAIAGLADAVARARVAISSVLHIA